MLGLHLNTCLNILITFPIFKHIILIMFTSQCFLNGKLLYLPFRDMITQRKRDLNPGRTVRS